MHKPTPSGITILKVTVQPQQAIVNQPVTIYANVVNRGDTPGTYSAQLKIDGQVVQTRSGGIGGNIGIPLKFTVSKDQSGTYRVDVNGQKSCFIVVDSAESKTGSPLNPSFFAYLLVGFLVVAMLVLGVLALRRLAS